MSVETGLSAYWDRLPEVHHAGTMLLGRTLCGESTIYMQIEEANVFDLVTCPQCAAKIRTVMRRFVADMEAIGGDDGD